MLPKIKAWIQSLGFLEVGGTKKRMDNTKFEMRTVEGQFKDWRYLIPLSQVIAGRTVTKCIESWVCLRDQIIVHNNGFHFCLKSQRKGPATPNTLIMSFEPRISFQARA